MIRRRYYIMDCGSKRCPVRSPPFRFMVCWELLIGRCSRRLARGILFPRTVSSRRFRVGTSRNTSSCRITSWSTIPQDTIQLFSSGPVIPVIIEVYPSWYQYDTTSLNLRNGNCELRHSTTLSISLSLLQFLICAITWFHFNAFDFILTLKRFYIFVIFTTSQ